jgi:hypothetical protein
MQLHDTPKSDLDYIAVLKLGTGPFVTPTLGGNAAALPEIKVNEKKQPAIGSSTSKT